MFCIRALSRFDGVSAGQSAGVPGSSRTGCVGVMFGYVDNIIGVRTTATIAFCMSSRSAQCLREVVFKGKMQMPENKPNSVWAVKGGLKLAC